MKRLRMSAKFFGWLEMRLEAEESDVANLSDWTDDYWLGVWMGFAAYCEKWPICRTDSSDRKIAVPTRSRDEKIIKCNGSAKPMKLTRGLCGCVWLLRVVHSGIMLGAWTDPICSYFFVSIRKIMMKELPYFEIGWTGALSSLIQSISNLFTSISVLG